MVYFDYFCLEIKRKHLASLFSFNLVGIFFSSVILHCRMQDKRKHHRFALLLNFFYEGKSWRIWIKMLQILMFWICIKMMKHICELLLIFLKKDMNEDKEKNVVQRSSMKDRRKGRKTSRKCLWTIEWRRFSWILSGVGNTEITSDFFFEGKWMERCHLRYISRETSIRRETSCFASFWIFFLKKNCQRCE